MAEEITCDTFFKALRSLDNFKGNCQVRVWLCQIAKNTYFSYCEHQKRKKIESLDTEKYDDVPSGEPSPEALMTHKEEMDTIYRRLHSLEEPYREVFMWRVYGELSFRQIGEIFGKSENWACVTYHRAKRKITEESEDKK